MTIYSNLIHCWVLLCSPGECTRGADTYKPVPADKGSYSQLVADMWINRLCPGGTGFDYKQCACIFGGVAATGENPALNSL